MLFPEQVKPLLSSPDREIRDQALHYFANSFHPDPELIPLYLKSWEKDPGNEQWSYLYQLSRLSVNEAGLTALRSALECVSTDSEREHLLDAIFSAPPELLTREVLDSLPDRKANELREFRLERRKELASCVSEKLWSELEDYCGEQHASRSLDYEYVDDLLDALADREFPNADTLVNHINGFSDDDDYDWPWIDRITMQLAGRRRLREAVPAIVRMMEIDTDVREEALDALARIGDPAAVTLIREGWSALEWHSRIFASTVFQRIPCIESESALLELLPEEQSPDITSWLADVLCRLFSEPGIPLIAEVIREERFDRFCCNLPKEILITCRALGIDHPDQEQWEAEVEESRRRAEERAQFFREVFRPAQERGQEQDSRDKLTASLPTPAHRSPAPHTQAVGTIRNQSAKVGCNSPCPCGSGKKFKKCCGR